MPMWVDMPSSRGSSQPTDRTQVCHIIDEFLPSEPPGKSKTKRKEEQIINQNGLSRWY